MRKRINIVEYISITRNTLIAINYNCLVHFANPYTPNFNPITNFLLNLRAKCIYVYRPPYI